MQVTDYRKLVFTPRDGGMFDEVDDAVVEMLEQGETVIISGHGDKDDRRKVVFIETAKAARFVEFVWKRIEHGPKGPCPRLPPESKGDGDIELVGMVQTVGGVGAPMMLVGMGVYGDYDPCFLKVSLSEEQAMLAAKHLYRKVRVTIDFGEELSEREIETLSTRETI